MMTQTQLNCFTLQFITHRNEQLDEVEASRLALEGGCRWIQLRMKDASHDEIVAAARKIMPLCREYEAVFLIDDHVDICAEVGADGVHLGKNDMDPAEARAILGNKAIIGGTCNTFADIQNIHDKVDYIGLGPFRFTTTKKKLSPVLGLDGYRNIVWQCRERGINTPIVAIGGITEADIIDIMNSGPNGIALSGTIMNADKPVETTERLVKTLRYRI